MSLTTCDFCGSKRVQHIIPCAPFAARYDPLIEFKAERNWRACPDCLEFVRQRDRRGLIKRCLSFHPEIAGRSRPEQERYMRRCAIIWGHLFREMGEPVASYLGGYEQTDYLDVNKSMLGVLCPN